MGILNDQQQQRALEVMQEFLSAPESEPSTSTEVKKRSFPLDQQRIEVIEQELKPLLADFMNGVLALEDFKSKIDSINKKNPYWGFKGFKGQMFFNLVMKVAEDLEECDQEIKSAILLPENDTIAASRIKTFDSYVKRISQQWGDFGNDSRGCPRASSIPFFLSYFWQIQDYTVWPVYYTNSVQMMSDLNLWEKSNNLSGDYITFKNLQHELVELFNENSKETKFDLYKVEHVLWFKGGNPLTNSDGEAIESKKEIIISVEDEEMPAQTQLSYLPESYVPPIVSILPRMARHEEELIEAAKRSGTTLEKDFEKKVNAAFTILGYETKLLGQGKGRVPDGLAISYDDQYAIIWDSKIRKDGYSLGTDDRTIREYINTQSRELKRRNSMRNIYYMIVSSFFSDDYDDPIRSIKMETDVSEVCLVEAEALVEIVDAKLRNPLQITLGSDGLQQLFANSGILSGSSVKEFFM